MPAALLADTVDALAQMDAPRLETLAAEAESLHPSEAQGIQVRALRNTLLELLQTTDANLRMLRELRALRVRGLGAVEADRWVR